MNLGDIAANIEPGDDEIWVSRTASTVSYPDHGNDLCFEIEDTSFWFQHRNGCLLAAMGRFPPGGLFWDIGGGNGYVSRAIQNAGWPVVLLEPGPRGAANARRRGIERIVCSTFEGAGFSAGSIPAAGAFDVVEHIRDDLAFVEAIERALIPGGRFYVTVPAFSFLWSQEDNEAGHLRRYTMAGLRGLLERAGLQVEYITYFFRFLPLPILMLRTLPYKLGMRRSEQDRVNRTSSDHRISIGPIQSAFQALLDREVDLIRSGRSMGFGGSLLAVVKKVSSDIAIERTGN